MEWTDVNIEFPVQYLDNVSAIAHMTVPYGIYIEDYSSLEEDIFEVAKIDLIDEELLKKDREKGIIHIYIKPEENPAEAVSYITEHISLLNIPYKISSKNIAEEDWENSWRKYYHPFRVGKHMIVCPEWEECETESGDIKIILNPGMAFGTGTHETTRLCMEMLEKYIRDDFKILDIGCGSGILSITSVLLGANSARGIDTDELAVKISGYNAELNNISDKVKFSKGKLSETNETGGTYDVICANIVADVIISILPQIPMFLKPGGIFLCSGIIDTRKEDVIAALNINGLNMKELNNEKGWIIIAAGT